MGPEIRLTVWEETQEGWRPIHPPSGVYGMDCAIRNEPGKGWMEIGDVRIRKPVDRHPQSGAPLPENAIKSDQLVARLEVEVFSPYDDRGSLTYRFDRCVITSDNEPEPGLEEFSFVPAQVEWRWTDGSGTTAPARVDFQSGSFEKGVAAIHLRGPWRGAEFEEAVDIYLRVPGWEGRSDDRDHHGWLDLATFHMKLNHRAIPGYPTQEQKLEIVRFPDQLSPRFAAACIEGLLLTDVSVEVVALRSRRVLLSYRFRNCHIAALHGGYASEPNGARDLFTESIDISFTDVDFQYFAADAGTREVRLTGGGATLAVPLSRVVPNSAFIIMWMDRNRSDQQETHTAIVDACKEAGITAVRADDLQHSDQVTDVVLEHIRTSDLVIADLTGERPNVYYEVGHAHAIGKKPILVRRTGSALHFDLANHNVREYSNGAELRAILRRRLADR